MDRPDNARELPQDSWLIWSRIAPGLGQDERSTGGLHLAATQADRYARWSLRIWRDEHMYLRLEVDAKRGWLAFAEVPEIFAGLGELDISGPCGAHIQTIDDVRNALPTLDDVIGVFEKHGAVHRSN